MSVFLRVNLLLLCAFFSYSSASQEGQTLGSTINRDVNQLSPEAAVADPDAPEKTRTEIIQTSASLRAQVAQLMFVSVSGNLSLTSEDRRLLREVHPGGVLLSNLSGGNNTREYTNVLLDLEKASSLPIPFFIACNMFETQEQSKTSIAHQFLSIPTPLAISAAGSNEATEGFIKSLASNLSTLGVNVHLGPSLRIHTADTPIKYAVNTFGSGVKQSIEMSAMFANAFSDENIAWSPLGFPGGVIKPNVPSVLISHKDQFIQHEILPYEAAVNAGVSMIHVGNTLTPMLDRSNVPSSLSPIMIKVFLRGYTGFDGIIVAGPADDSIIELDHSPGEAAVAMIKAGADMVLWDELAPSLKDAVDAIVAAVIDGEIPPQQISESYQRIVELKEDLGLFDRETISRRKSSALDIKNNRDSSTDIIERRSITLLKNNNGLLPLSKKTTIGLGVTGYYGVSELFEELRNPFKKISRQLIISAEHTGKVEDFDIDRVKNRTSKWQTVICVFDPNMDLPHQREILLFLRQSNKKVIVVLLGVPEDMGHYYNADAILLAYSQRNNLTVTMKAIRDVIVGEGPVDLVTPGSPVNVRVDNPVQYNIYEMVRNPSGQIPIPIGKDIPYGYSLSYRSENALKKVAWDFGDGKSSRDWDGEYQYKDSGNYFITLTIKTEDGEEKSERYPARVLP